MPEPMTLHILGKPYRLDFLPTNQLPANMGTCNRGRQVICIDESLGKEQVEDTTLHEVLHIIDGERSILRHYLGIQRLLRLAHFLGTFRLLLDQGEVLLQQRALTGRVCIAVDVIQA